MADDRTYYPGEQWWVLPTTTDKLGNILNFQFGAPVGQSRVVALEYIGGRDWVVVVAPPTADKPNPVRVKADMYNLLCDLEDETMSVSDRKRRVLEYSDRYLDRAVGTMPT